MRPSTLRRAVPALLLLALPQAAPAQGEPTLERARQAVESRRYPEAQAALEPYARAHPKDGEAAFWLGRAYFAQGKIDEAAGAFERVTELQPARAEGFLWLGRAYGQQALKANKFRQAMLAKKVQHAFERAVQLDPSSIEARDGLVDFYMLAPGFMGGSTEKAEAQVAAIRRLNPFRGHLSASRVASQRHDPAGAEQELVRAVAESPDSLAGVMQLANLYATSSQFDRAFAIVEGFLARHPDNMAARYAIGRLAAASGQQMERGEQMLRGYLAYTPGPDEPSHAGAWFRLGQLHEKQGRRDDALREYQTATRLDPRLKAAADAAKRLGG